MRSTWPTTFVRGWAGGTDVPASAREPIDQAVEPAIVFGLQHHGVRANQKVRLDERDLLPCQTGTSLDPGAVEPVEASNCGRLIVLRIEVPLLACDDRRLTLQDPARGARDPGAAR